MGETLRVLRYFWRFVRPYRGKFFLALCLLLISVPLSQLAIFLTRDVTNQALAAQTLPASERWSIVLRIIQLQAVFLLSSAVLSTFREVLEWYASMRSTFDLRLYYYRHLHKLPLSYLTKRAPGEHLFRATTDMVSMFRTANRLPTPTASGQTSLDSKEVAMAIYSNDVDPYDPGIMGMIVRTVPLMVETIYALGWGAALLYLIHPGISLILVLYIIPFTLVSNRLFDRVRGTALDFKAASEQESGTLRDSIAGLRTLKSFGRTRRQRLKYMKSVIGARRFGVKQISEIVHAQNIIQMLMRWGFSMAIYIFVTIRVLRGESTVGDWIATFLLVEAAQAPLENFVQLLQSIKMQQVPALRLLETLQTEPSITDLPDAKTLPPLRGAVQFRSVSFSYEAGVPVLREVSFDVQPGQYLGIVGPSGAGKSSIVNLILRMYKADAGAVLVDGHDVSEIVIQSLLDQVGTVPQSTYLYSGTIEENIRFGNPWVTDAELAEALQMAGMQSVLERMTEGLQTLVGEGNTISGGERQRIGIARALVRNPKILILDEATANLDPITEQSVLESLEKLREGRTILSIAHRLKAVEHCDHIIVLDKGQILERGKHQELLQQQGLYWSMWNDQMHDSSAYLEARA